MLSLIIELVYYNLFSNLTGKNWEVERTAINNLRDTISGTR